MSTAAVPYLDLGAQFAAIGADVTDFAVGAVVPTAPGELGRHLYLVEFATSPPSAAVATFAQAVDESLSAANDDYRAHRAGGYGMASPEVRAVPAGAFAGWMKAHGKLGGQHKVPRVITDGKLFTELAAFMT